MRIQTVVLVSLFWLAALTAEACDYVDDPRLSNEQLPTLIAALKAGDSVPPIQMRISTYLQLHELSRVLFEPHLAIFDVNCAPISGVDGQLSGRAVIPFEEFYRAMAQAINDNRPDIAKQLYTRVRVAPVSVANMQRMFGQLPYPGSHGLQVREKMQTIYPRFSNALPLDKQLTDRLIDGRSQDYAMFKLFQIFGGELQLEQGCGPYPLDQMFYKTETVTSAFGEREVQLVSRKPFVHMMQAMGHQVSEVDKTSYRIVNINCQ